MAKRFPYISGWCGSNAHERCLGVYAGCACKCSICGDHVTPAVPVKNFVIGATASYRLIEAQLGRPLAAHVAECRTAGLGWRTIANDLRDTCHVGLSHESLRGWFSTKTLEAS
jgi:hypothetical protein